MNRWMRQHLLLLPRTTTSPTISHMRHSGSWQMGLRRWSQKSQPKHQCCTIRRYGSLLPWQRNDKAQRWRERIAGGVKFVTCVTGKSFVEYLLEESNKTKNKKVKKAFLILKSTMNMYVVHRPTHCDGVLLLFTVQYLSRPAPAALASSSLALPSKTMDHFIYRPMC